MIIVRKIVIKSSDLVGLGATGATDEVWLGGVVVRTSDEVAGSTPGRFIAG